MIKIEDADLNYTKDITDVMNDSETEMTPSEKLGRFYLSLLTVKQADRRDVKHYPLDDLAIGVADVVDRLSRIKEIHWMTFCRVVEERIAESGIPLSILNFAAGDIGEVLVCSPNRFSHIGQEVEELKPFAFGYREKDSEGVRIKTEMNYTVVIR